MAELGGRESMVGQFDELFSAAGLRRTAVLETDSPLCVVEAMTIER